MSLRQASQTTGLRGARFSPPRAPPVTIERTHLADLIDKSGTQVVVICAPAGFGKSTLMQQSCLRFQARGAATAWLQVEQADNDLACFLRSLSRSIQGAFEAPIAGPSLDVPVANANPTQGRAADLLERLSFSDTPIALFLDDLELIVDEEVWAFLQRLLTDLDTRHRLFLASRTRPPLALARMRAYGCLLELDQTQLRFTSKETQAFLERQNIGTPAIRTLQQHTEGWPAALQLATAALNAKPGSNALRFFSGASASVAEYLVQEILDSRSARQRDFLLHSAVLGQFCAELCDAALERHDGEEMIAQILRDNLLLTPVDVEQCWYSFHPLLADFLRAQAARDGEQEVKCLHGRAAHWMAARGFTNEAITHALAADHRALAADLLAASAMDSVHSGRVADTARAIAALTDAEIYERPQLLRAAAFAAIFAHRYEAARRYMEIIERMGGARVESDDDAVAQRLMLLAWTDSIPDLLQAVEGLHSRARHFGRFTAGLTANARAFCHIALGRYVEAERDLALAREACEPIDAIYVLSYSACFAAAMALNFGQVATARATLERAFNRAIDSGQRYGSAGAVVATYLTECLYEADELDACQALVDDYMPIVTETGLPDHLIMFHRIAARLHFLRGYNDAGHAVLVQLGEIGARRGLRRLTAAAWLERSYAYMRGNDFAGARHAVAAGSDAMLWGSLGAFKPHAGEIDDVAIARLRLQLVTGEGGDALLQIQGERQIAEGAERRRRALRLLFLESQTHDRIGRRREAAATFDQAVTRAIDGGMVRVLVDEAWATERLVVRSAVVGEPCAVALLRKLREPPVGWTAATRGNTTPEIGGSAARLTTREVQILRLVWKGGSNKAIARDLFLSENTIETHLRRIYEKLGTRKRTQAAALAREAGAI